jgi:hypothetical protein
MLRSSGSQANLATPIARTNREVHTMEHSKALAIHGLLEQERPDSLLVKQPLPVSRQVRDLFGGPIWLRTRDMVPIPSSPSIANRCAVGRSGESSVTETPRVF